MCLLHAIKRMNFSIEIKNKLHLFRFCNALHVSIVFVYQLLRIVQFGSVALSGLPCMLNLP